jgi:hypothetical protein
VLERADKLAGEPTNGRPTKQGARDALLALVDDDLAKRYHAADKLSRASYWGFDHDSRVDDDGNVTTNITPSLEIRTATLKPLPVFRDELKTRLSEVGYYRQKAIEHQSPNRPFVCCHCQIVTHFDKGNWRECPTCGRHFCRRCKGLLRGHAHTWRWRRGDWLPSIEHGERMCDGPWCGAQTRLIAA